MQTIKIDSVLRGFCQRPELWRLFYAFWATMALMLVGFFLALVIAPGLGVWAILFPVLIFAGLCFWKLKAYKARFVDPVDAIIRQADTGERVGVFLFLSFFMGSLGWGCSFLLLAVIYSSMTDDHYMHVMVTSLYSLKLALLNGFALGAIMASFKLADIFKQKKITYALYAVLALIFLFSL